MRTRVAAGASGMLPDDEAIWTLRPTSELRNEVEQEGR
jgi:hypothetical protein